MSAETCPACCTCISRRRRFPSRSPSTQADLDRARRKINEVAEVTRRIAVVSRGWPKPVRGDELADVLELIADQIVAAFKRGHP
jgi:hypothetical protein